MDLFEFDGSEVRLHRSCTVKEFVDECLTRKGRWGVVGVYLPEEELDHELRRFSEFLRKALGDFSLEYKEGEILSENPLLPKYYDRPVKNVTCEIRLPRIDYVLYI